MFVDPCRLQTFMVVFGPNQERVRLPPANLLAGFPIRKRPCAVLRDATKTVQEVAEEALVPQTNLDDCGGHSTKAMVSRDPCLMYRTDSQPALIASTAFRRHPHDKAAVL
jgi:hypothetical protein